MSASADNQVFDVVVAGGGLVGATLALALGPVGARVALVDSATGGDGADLPRPVALAEGSRRILQGLGLWETIGAGASPIRAIHVSDRGRFGFTRIRASDYGITALGYVSEASVIGAALDDALSTAAGVTFYRPYSVAEIAFSDEHIELSCDGPEKPLRLRTRLLAAADGGRSAVRRLSGIPARTRDWGQSAITASVRTRLDHDQVAYERFTADGPLALLPTGRRRAGLVWTLPHARADALMEMSDAGFLNALEKSFGTRLGPFVEAGRRTRHRLRSAHSRVAVKPRLALVGNAANSLHPVAGQGLNLGLRDAAVLAELVADAMRSGSDPGAAVTLRRYADWRRGDQWSTSHFTESLVRLFSNNAAPLALLRDAGLVGINSVPVFRRALAQSAMGLGGRATRLARGLPL